jgi:nitroimidazol reductase NimA-like FMN-containing flavoprotein (pyridoxamine 5'-phosphate oxidase superfamily)
MVAVSSREESPVTAPSRCPHTVTSLRSRIRIHPERSRPEEAHDILAAGLVAHVGFVDGGQPFVIPMTYQFDPARPEHLYLHGAHHSRLMQHLATGAPICVTVTMVDGLVYSKTALFHSLNYRSVVVFGRAGEEPPRPERRRLLEGMVGRYWPGRTAGCDYDPIPDDHLDPTAFVAIRIEELSAKVRRGGPKGPRDGDPAAPGTAGVTQLAR